MTLQDLYSYFKDGCKLHPLINTFAVISDEASIANDNAEYNVDDRDKVYYLNKRLTVRQVTVLSKSEPPYLYIRRDSSNIKNFGSPNYSISQTFELLCLMDDHIILSGQKIKQTKKYHRQEIFEMTQRILIEVLSYLCYRDNSISSSLVNGVQIDDFVDSVTKLSGSLCKINLKVNCVNYNNAYWNSEGYWIDGDGTYIDDGQGNKIKVT